MNIVPCRILQERLLFTTNIESLRCIICHEIPLCPFECAMCQSIFCSECIASWQRIKNICPLQCPPPLTLKPMIKPLHNMIKSLKLTCINKPKGCPFEGDYVRMQIHEYKECGYRLTHCENACLEEGLLIKDLEKHSEICVFSKKICFCCGVEINKFEQKSHNCLLILIKKKDNLTKKLKKTEVFIEKCENLIVELKEEHNVYVGYEKNIEKFLNNQIKDVRGVIRKQIDREVEKNRYKLKKIDPQRIEINITDEYKVGFCCEKQINLNFLPEKIIKICKNCGLNRYETRFNCKICDRNYCIKCKKPEFNQGKCPINHKYVFTKIESQNSWICWYCLERGKNFCWLDKACEIMICEQCYSTKKRNRLNPLKLN